MIKYLGSKRALLDPILDAVTELAPAGRVLDLFSGSARVSRALKQAGYAVVANDHNAYAATVARAQVEADREDWQAPAEAELARLQELADALPDEDDAEVEEDWFTCSYCRESRYFRPANGRRIARLREELARAGHPPLLEAVLLAALMEAADRVDSTVGVHMAYLKAWAPRARKSLELRPPELLPRPPAGPCQAWEREALDAACAFDGDLAYLDPPYNHHSYLGNYHLWETLVRWDEPETYGVARKRIDVRERKSPFNSKPRCAEALAAVLEALDGMPLVVSFSDEGFLDAEAMEALLGRHGRVERRSYEHRRYVGARIGIHDPAGRRVGAVSHVRNRERLFLVRP